MKLVKNLTRSGILILLVSIMVLLTGCFTYSGKVESIIVDEESIPKEVTISDFNISDINLIVNMDDGTSEVISVTKDMLSDQALEKLTKSGTHYIYIRYKGKIALAIITLLDNYPNVLINFDSNGGSSVKRQVIEKNSLALRPTNPTRNGYQFTGWYTDITLTTLFDFSQKVINSVTLYAGWEPVKNIIKFETNGGSRISDGVFTTGEEMVLPADPIKEGYSFSGWYVDKELTVKYSIDIVSSSFTLYAGWIASSCTVVFEENGGSEIGDLVVSYDNKVVEPKAPTRYGYILEGWYLDREFTQKYDFDSLVKGNLTLYANWIEAKYTVKFETNGGTLLDDIVLTHDEFLPATVITTKENYKFSGWYLDQNLTIPFDQTIGVTSNLTLYAKWEGIVCTISFESNGAEAIDDIKVNYGENATKPTNPTKEGFIFAGWFTDSDLTKSFNFGTVIREDIKLYAKWVVDSNVKPKYTVTLYDGNFNVFKTFEVYEGELLNNLATPEMPGLAFEGWYLDQSFETKYDLTIPVTINLNLYSNFVETYVVTFVNREGNVIKVVEVMSGYDVAPIDAPSIEGYDFVGWNHSLKAITSSFTASPLYELHKYKATFMVGDTAISVQNITRGEVATSPATISEHATTGYHFAGWDKELAPMYADTVYTAKFEKNVYTVQYVDYYGKVYHTDKYQHGEKVTRPDFDGNEYIQLNGWYTDNTFTNRYQFNNEILANVTVYGRFDFVNSISYVVNDNEITITNLYLRNVVDAEIPDYLNDKYVVGVERITNYDKVKTLTINSHLKNIDISELSNISTLEAITVNSNGKYTSSNGILYEGNKLVLYPASKANADVRLTVTSIGEYAFRNNKNIVRLTLPNATSIKNNAFDGSNITHISLEQTATKEANSFNNIKDNLVILVPSAKYSDYTTNWNDVASHIYSTSSIYNDFLYKVDGGNVEIVEYLGDDAKVVVPDKIDAKNVTKINAYAFNNLPNLIGLELGEYVSDVSDDAFNGLNLKYLIIKSGVVLSDSYKASLKTMLKDTNVYIKDSEIGNYDFTNKYLLSAIDGDFAYVTIGGKYGIIEYFGNNTEIVIPEVHNLQDVEFLKKGFSTSNIDIITINSMIDIEDGAIGEATLVVVSDELVDTYKAKYKTLAIYPKTMIISTNANYVYGTYDDEVTIIRINATDSNIVIPDTLGGHVVTTIGKYALINNNKVRKITINNTIEFIDLYALRSASSENVLEIVFTKLVAPNVGGEICYLTDKIYKESEVLREYGARFPSHTVSVYNAEVFETSDYRYSINGKFATILKYLGNDSEVTIPETINGYSVIRVASFAFSTKKVTKITVLSNIIHLEYLAFGGALDLAEVVIDSPNVIELESLATNTPAVIRVSDDLVHRYKLNENWKNEEVIGLSTNLVTYKDIIYYIDEDGKAVIVRMDETYSKITLDSVLGGCDVARLAPYAMYYSDVKTLTLSQTVEVIGYNALPKDLSTLIIRNMAAPSLEKQDGAFIINISDEYKSTANKDYYNDFVVLGLYEENGVSGDFEYQVLDGECIITKYNGNSNNVVIPSLISTYTVKKIGVEAFKGNLTLTEVTIPSSVKYVLDSAFYGCTNLQTINFGGGLIYIGLDAFTNTKFMNNNTNKLVVIDKVLYKYQSKYDGTGQIVIDSTISSISPRAFYGGTTLTSVVIPNSINDVGYEAFSGCTNLTSVSLPNSLRNISDGMFSNCTRLKEVTFGNKLERIGANAFSGCTYLERIDISNQTIFEEVLDGAFSGCSSLISITLPASIRYLSPNAFLMCSNLEEVVLSNDLYYVSGGLLYNKDKTILYGDLLKSRERVISVLDTTTRISEDAFNGSKATKVIINSNVTIGKNAFTNNDKLTSIVFMTNKLNKFALEAIQTDATIYILNSLLGEARGDEVYKTKRVRGVISFNYDSYTIKVGSAFTALPTVAIDLEGGSVTYRTMDENVLALVNGEFVGVNVGTVKLIAYLNIGEVQTAEVTINVVK